MQLSTRHSVEVVEERLGEGICISMWKNPISDAKACLRMDIWKDDLFRLEMKIDRVRMGPVKMAGRILSHGVSR